MSAAVQALTAEQGRELGALRRTALRVLDVVVQGPAEGVQQRDVLSQVRTMDWNAFKNAVTALVCRGWVLKREEGHKVMLVRTSKCPSAEAVREELDLRLRETRLADAAVDGETPPKAKPPQAPQAPQGVPDGVPNSVWALGAALGSAPAPAAAEAPPAPPAAAVPVFAAAPAAAPLAPGLGFKQAAKDAPRARTGVPAVPAALMPPWRPAAVVLDDVRAPRFELHSDGVLVIDEGGGDVVALRPTVTRALFRWLDRLGGLELERTLPEAEGAAS